jgi:hypothetical protein
MPPAKSSIGNAKPVSGSVACFGGYRGECYTGTATANKGVILMFENAVAPYMPQVERAIVEGVLAIGATHRAAATSEKLLPAALRVRVMSTGKRDVKKFTCGATTIGTIEAAIDELATKNTKRETSSFSFKTTWEPLQVPQRCVVLPLGQLCAWLWSDFTAALTATLGKVRANAPPASLADFTEIDAMNGECVARIPHAAGLEYVDLPQEGFVQVPASPDLSVEQCSDRLVMLKAYLYTLPCFRPSTVEHHGAPTQLHALVRTMYLHRGGYNAQTTTFARGSAALFERLVVIAVHSAWPEDYGWEGVDRKSVV